MIVFLLACLACLPAPIAAPASAPARSIAVLDREQQWLTAVTKRDARALSGILAENFVHVTYRGSLRYRSDELDAIAKSKPYAQKTSQQTVDFAGDAAAIVHGINTITESGRVVMRLRYTDVWALQSGSWRALSAQESAIASH